MQYRRLCPWWASMRVESGRGPSWPVESGVSCHGQSRPVAVYVLSLYTVARGQNSCRVMSSRGLARPGGARHVRSSRANLGHSRITRGVVIDIPHPSFHLWLEIVIPPAGIRALFARFDNLGMEIEALIHRRIALNRLFG